MLRKQRGFAVRRAAVGRGLLWGCAVSLIFWALAASGLLQPLEWMSLDARFVLRAALGRESSERPVTVVAIDDAALQAIGRWPWPRSVQAHAIEMILAERPSALGIDILYSEPELDTRGDLQLAQALRGDIPIVLAASKSGGAEMLPLLTLAATNVSNGHVNTVPDPDGVVRRLPWTVSMRNGPMPAFVGAMAANVSEASALSPPPLDPQGNLLINYQLRRGADLGKSALAEIVSILEVIEGRASDRLLDRPVVLGVTAQSSGAAGEHITSFRSLGAVPSALVHANALAALLEGRHLRSQPGWDVFWLLLLGPLAGAIGFSMRPWPATGTTLALGALFLGAAAWQFAWNDQVAAVVAPMGTLVVTYVAGLWHAHFQVEREVRRIRSTFERYVAPEVVGALLSEPGAAQTQGGRRTVSVLFADLRGFTAYAEQRQPEQVVQLLNRYLTLMAESVFLYGGMVDKFVGDGIMAVFGAPLPQKDHALAAVRAGMHLLRRVEALQGPRAERLSVGVGIHTGEAVVGSIGSARRMEYTAVGDAVNVASRLQEMAAPGTLTLSEDTLALLPDAVRAKAARLDSAAVRGRHAPVAAYRISLDAAKEVAT